MLRELPADWSEFVFGVLFPVGRLFWRLKLFEFKLVGDPSEVEELSVESGKAVTLPRLRDAGIPGLELW